MDKETAGIAAVAVSVALVLTPGRGVDVDLAINPNTLVRAYREMEVRGILDTHQGTGTFVAESPFKHAKDERHRQLSQLATEFVARAGSAGFKVNELLEALRQLSSEVESKRR